MAEPPTGTSSHRALAHGRHANHRRYHDGAEVDGYVDDPYHRVRRAVAARLMAEGVTGGGPVLELGCGPRGMLDPDALPGPLVLADMAEAALGTARAVTGGRALPVCLDATRGLPFRAGSFAGLLAGELIEHVYDPLALLRECHRVLAPDGLAGAHHPESGAGAGPAGVPRRPGATPGGPAAPLSVAAHPPVHRLAAAPDAAPGRVHAGGPALQRGRLAAARRAVGGLAPAGPRRARARRLR